MSDPGADRDPMATAYLEAEAALDDADARAARRARVLAAVAQEPTPVSAPPIRMSAWRRGRWLAAACVAGLGVLVAIQIYHPAGHDQQVATAPAPTTAGQRLAAPPAAAPAATASEASSSQAAAVAPAPPMAMPAPPPALAKAEPPLPPPLAPEIAPAPRAVPAAAPPPPPPPRATDDVAAERRESLGVVAQQSTARGAAEQAPVAISAFTGPSSADQATRDETLGGMPADRAADLRAAAAAGRTADLKALLAQGVPVDAPDADGDTALMKSVRADHPATAALLLRHGASLDRKNQAGESARDMAKALGDAALDQALGLGP
jgi:hypothetical protein